LCIPTSPQKSRHPFGSKRIADPEWLSLSTSVFKWFIMLECRFSMTNAGIIFGKMQRITYHFSTMVNFMRDAMIFPPGVCLLAGRSFRQVLCKRLMHGKMHNQPQETSIRISKT